MSETVKVEAITDRDGPFRTAISGMPWLDCQFSSAKNIKFLLGQNDERLSVSDREGRRVFAMARPAALPVPARRDVNAFTKPAILDRWSDDGAGIRALERGDNVITMFDIDGDNPCKLHTEQQLRALRGPFLCPITIPGLSQQFQTLRAIPRALPASL